MVELRHVLDQLLLRVAPGEVGVGLLEADLGELAHHLRPRERLGEEDHVRDGARYFADQPFPERERLGVRVVDAEDLARLARPRTAPCRAARARAREGRSPIEVDVDDVLVLLRRVLGELDAAVGPPVEPFRMLLDPGMIGRALDREIERDLQAMLVGGSDERAGSRRASPSSGWIGVVAALRRADGVDAARIVRARPAASCCGLCGWCARSDGSA